MPTDLSTARLRALIAAARPNTSYCAYCGQPDDKAAQALADYLDENAPALADDIEKARLLEWAASPPYRWYELYFKWDGESDFIDTLRAAKEAADGKI